MSIAISANTKEPLFIIKIGGNVIDNKKSLLSFLSDFSFIKNKKILVHGGGKIATAIGDKLGIKSNYIDGRRITDDATIDLVTMVYGGLVNKTIVAALQSLKCNAIGLCGADANVLAAHKRQINRTDYGWVGDTSADETDATMMQLFLDNNLIPVMAPLTHDGEGNILNTNADTITAVIAVALSKLYAVNLIYCFEKDGVLADINDESSVIAQLRPDSYEHLKQEQRLYAGILPKIDNAFAAMNKGVSKVIIGNSINLKDLIQGKSGTTIIA